MSAIDATILIGFVIYAVVSGLRSREVASRDLEQYFLAGRSLGGVQAGLSMAATQFAADTPLLVCGLIATQGIFGLWRLWIYGVAFLLLGFVLAPAWRRAAVLTDAELSEVRYGGRPGLWLRATKAVYFGLICNCAVLAMVLFAATRICEPFLHWDQWLPTLHHGVAFGLSSLQAKLTVSEIDVDYGTSANNAISLLVILTVTVFYSTTGGLRSVVRTDMLQLALALGGTAILAYVLWSKVGGAAGFSTRLDAALAQSSQIPPRRALLAFTPGVTQSAGTAWLGVLGLQWLLQMNADGTGYLAQRCMACRSDADATSAALIFSWTQIVFRSLLWLPIGLSLLVLYPEVPSGVDEVAYREASYVRAIADFLPVGARGILLTAMFAALASTLDTHLNWGAGYLTHDLYERVYCSALRGVQPSARALVRVARLANVLLVAVAAYLVTLLSSIQTAWQLTLLFGAGMGVPLVLRWLWWRMTALSELASIVASAVLAPLLLHWFPAEQEALRLLCMALGTTFAVVVTALWVRPARASDPALVRFYHRVQPPGFWGPVAREAGAHARSPLQELGKRLGRLAAGVGSLFCSLVGLGTWLVDGSVPEWIPWPGAWIPCLLGISLLLIPVWWPRSTRPA